MVTRGRCRSRWCLLSTPSDDDIDRHAQRGGARRAIRRHAYDAVDSGDRPADDGEDYRDSWSDVDGSGLNNSNDDDPLSFQQAASTTLREHLLDQLGVTTLPTRDRALDEMLIDALDDDGYLTTSLEEVASLTPAEIEIEPEEWRTALALLQNFDPVGVAARSPAECLKLQLLALPTRTRPRGAWR